MPRRNKVEIQGLVDRIVDMFYNQNLSQREIAEKLKEEGFDVSKSGIVITLVDYAGQMKAYKEAAIEAANMVKELKNEAGLNLAETTSQLLQVKLLSAVKDVEVEDLDEMKLNDLISAVHKNTLSQVQIARVKLEYERGYKKGLFAAAELVETEGKKAGISDENIEIIKAKLLGLEVKTDD